MDNDPRSPDGITIRPPATDAELELFFQVAAMQFVRDVPFAIAGADFRRFVERAPGADPTRIRGAFRGDTYLGGYLIDDRDLRIGPVRLRTGCVGVVVTRPDFRGQGVGTALMNDALAFARSRGHVLLLLHGLANFYEPFGYVDVFDATEYSLDRGDVLAHPPSPYRVRPATAADAEAMLALYDRHFGPCPGSFTRSVAQQSFQIEFSASLDTGLYRTREGTPYAPPVVAVDGGGAIRGYLVAPWGPFRFFGNEITADDWPATLALLQHDARRRDDLRWPLPPGGLTASLLADHFTVRAETLHRPRANWMAALVDPAGLLSAFRPTWEARLRCGLPSGTRGLELGIEDAATIRLRTPEQSDAPDLPRINLPARVLLPLIFGFRSARWAVAHPEASVPDDLVTVLDDLFPSLQPWIPATDGF